MINYLMSFCIALLSVISVQAQAFKEPDQPVVLASIHPLALVAASVVPTSHLNILVPPGMTPHDFSLRPSDIDLIQAADIIVWSGVENEPYLKGFARRWPDKIWLDASEMRTAGMTSDPHIWFAPELMKRLQARLAGYLGVDGSGFAAAVDRAMTDSDVMLAEVRQRGFFVFHRAYDHWVGALQLNQLGAFTLTPEQRPGLRTLRQMRKQLERGDVVCVFSEPEFSPALVNRLTDGLEIGRGELDPMAMHIAVTPTGYASMLLDMAAEARTCLEKTLISENALDESALNEDVLE